MAPLCYFFLPVRIIMSPPATSAIAAAPLGGSISGVTIDAKTGTAAAITNKTSPRMFRMPMSSYPYASNMEGSPT